MNIKSALVLLSKIIVLTVVMFILFSVGSAVITSHTAAAEMSTDPYSSSCFVGDCAWGGG